MDAGKQGKRLTAEAIYEGDGILRLVEPVELPVGAKLRVTIEPAGAEPMEKPKGLAVAAERLGLDFDSILEAIEAPEGLREALEELVEHMARSMEEAVARDGRLRELYRAAERLEPGHAAERIGPPPLDNDTWMLMLSDVLTVVEKAGLLQLTQPLRVAANNRLVNPYDLALAALRGDRGFLDHEAERLHASRELVYLAAAALAEATRRAVARLLEAQEGAESGPDVAA